VFICSNAHASYWLLWPTLLYNFLPHYLTKALFSGKKTEHKNVCFGFLYSFCLKCFFFILRRTERDMNNNVYHYLCKAPLFLSDFNKTWIFSTDSPEGADMFHEDRRTDKHDEVNSNFFAIMRKHLKLCSFRRLLVAKILNPAAEYSPPCSAKVHEVRHIVSSTHSSVKYHNVYEVTQHRQKSFRGNH